MGRLIKSSTLIQVRILPKSMRPVTYNSAQNDSHARGKTSRDKCHFEFSDHGLKFLQGQKLIRSQGNSIAEKALYDPNDPALLVQSA